VLVGRLQWRRGIHVALDAWAAVKQRLPKAHLHLVGGSVEPGDDYQRQLDALFARHQLTDSVTRHGRVADQQLDTLLGGATVVLIPEQWETMSPLMLLRAMERKKAIVASKIGGIPGLTRHEKEALLAEPKDAPAFASAIIRLLEDRALACSLAEGAASRLAGLCAPASARQAWQDLYRELFETTPNSG
jgi:glycosyltransferase involved in cell wall biosynthesis